MSMIESPDEIDIDVDIIAQHGPFNLSKTGVTFMRQPSYEEWVAATEWCQHVEKASPFWVGDLLAYGDRFGEMASQVLEATGYAEQTFKNTKHVCKVIPPERRRAGLPFSHHQEIAAIPNVEEQEFWLNEAEAKDLTREQLRVRIKAAKSEAAGAPVELWLHVRCESVEAQQELAERLVVEGFSVKFHAKEA